MVDWPRQVRESLKDLDDIESKFESTKTKFLEVGENRGERGEECLKFGGDDDVLS